MSMTDGFSDGSSVATSPTFIGRKGATRIARPSAVAASSARRPTANGMILTVATICPARHDREFRHGRDRDRRVDAVQPVDSGAIDDDEPGLLANRGSIGR